MARVNPKALLLKTFDAAIVAANPESAVRQHLPARPTGRVVVIACGKAAPAMLRGLSDWGEVAGVAVTTAGQTLPELEGIAWLEAPHSLPDQRSVAAGRMMLTAVSGLSRDDLVLCLISGGSSALCCVPNQITLGEKIAQSLTTQRREHRGNQHGQKAPVRHQGWAIGAGGVAREARGADRFRRGGRRDQRDWLGHGRAGSDDCGRRDQCAAPSRDPSTSGADGDAQTD